MRPRRLPSVLLALAVLATPACDATGDDPTEIVTDPPFGEAPDDDPANDPATPLGDEPVPVEGEGGIGGEGGGPVTSNLILSADRVEVTGTCLVTEDPPTYRLDLAGGGVLTVEAGSPGVVRLERDGATFASPEEQPPVVSPSDGAIAVQSRVVSDAGEEFVDAVIGLDDLPDC